MLPNLSDAIKSILRDYLEGLLVAILIAVALRWFVLGAYKVPNQAMSPALKNGDFIIGFKLPYILSFFETPFSHSTPKRGQILVFEYPDEPGTSYAKRVVAIEGDRVEWENQKLILNGVEAEYTKLGPYNGQADVYSEKINGQTRIVVRSKQAQEGHIGPLVVPPAHFFTLNDNRMIPDDSRRWGMIPHENVESKVSFIWLSLDWIKSADSSSTKTQIRWARMLKPVH